MFTGPFNEWNVADMLWSRLWRIVMAAYASPYKNHKVIVSQHLPPHAAATHRNTNARTLRTFIPFNYIDIWWEGYYYTAYKYTCVQRKIFRQINIFIKSVFTHVGNLCFCFNETLQLNDPIWAVECAVSFPLLRKSCRTTNSSRLPVPSHDSPMFRYITLFVYIYQCKQPYILVIMQIIRVTRPLLIVIWFATLAHSARVRLIFFSAFLNKVMSVIIHRG